MVSGICLARYVLPAFPRVLPARYSADFRAAVVFGSIAPDCDLFLAAVAVALTWDPAWVELLHRTGSHSLPVMALFAVLSMRMCPLLPGWVTGVGKTYPAAPEDAAACAPLQRGATGVSACGEDASQPDVGAGCGADGALTEAQDPWLWQALVAFAGGPQYGSAVATILGGILGMAVHSVADCFYIVPVELLWPVKWKFAMSLVLPIEQFTNQDYKVFTCMDFMSDILYFAPVICCCWRYDFHRAAWPKLAAFWAAQLLTVVGFYNSSLMAESAHWEDFMYWFHCPCGILFIAALNFSPVLVPDAIRLLTTPPPPAAAHRRPLLGCLTRTAM